MTRRQLQRFGLTLAAATVVFLGLLVPWLLNVAPPIWPWVVAAGIVFWAFASPGTFRGVVSLWTLVGELLHRVTSPLLMAAMFLLLVVPTGLLMRLARKDPMSRNRMEAKATFRTPSTRRSPQHMERPY